MEQQNHQPSPPVFVPAPLPPSYLTQDREIRFGLCLLISCFCMANFILKGGFALGFALTVIGTIGLSADYLLRSGKTGSAYSKTILVLCLIIAAGFGRSNDAFVKFVLFLFLLVGTNLGLCLLAGQNRQNPGSLLSLLDAGRSLFMFGFGKISRSISGVDAYFREGTPANQRTGAIMLGGVIAIPVLAVVIPLLIQADAAFDGLISLLPDVELGEIAHSALWGSMLCVVLYCRSVALNHHNEEEEGFRFGRQLNHLTINTLLIAVSLVYVCYLLSQLAYFVGGFSGILPEGYSTSEYARRGFFEMAWLCAINLGIMTFSMGLLDRVKPAPLSTRLICLFIGLVSLFFIASSFAKMGLYISVYGLTRLRVLTMVILVFFTVTVIFVGIWLFVPRLPYMKAIVLAALILGAGVLWMDVDTQVARYNVDAYLSGSLDSIDTAHLSGLGDGAVPAIARLTEDENSVISRWARQELTERRSSCRKAADFRGWNQIHANTYAFLEQWNGDVQQQ